MEAIETMTIAQNGHTYRIAIYADPDALNPLNDSCEMGTILSLNRRHVNFDPAGVESAIENNPDAVPLSYYEHGLCLWSIAGELPAGSSLPVRFGAIRRCLAARRGNAGIREELWRQHPPPFHAQARPPGMRRLYAVVQWRRLWL